jgi:hypothetical protein
VHHSTMVARLTQARAGMSFASPLNRNSRALKAVSEGVLGVRGVGEVRGVKLMAGRRATVTCAVAADTQNATTLELIQLGKAHAVSSAGLQCPENRVLGVHGTGVAES